MEAPATVHAGRASRAVAAWVDAQLADACGALRETLLDEFAEACIACGAAPGSAVPPELAAAPEWAALPERVSRGVLAAVAEELTASKAKGRAELGRRMDKTKDARQQILNLVLQEVKPEIPNEPE